MLKRTLVTGVLGGVVSLAGQGAFADSATLTEAISGGEAHLAFRLRYENVQVDNAAGTFEDDVTTLKTRLNYKTDSFKGFSGFLEFDDVTADDSTYTVSDPEGTEVNQAYLAYSNWDTTFKWGRQRITLDNHRFVGHVGWRQNEQTYDAFSIVNQSVKDLTVSYAHISNVNRIFGEGSAAGDTEMDDHLLNINYKAGSLGSITGYVYILESDDSNTAFATWNSDTAGIRWTNSLAAGDVTIDYVLEYAKQQDGHDSPLEYEADYWTAEISATMKPVKLTLGVESLGADGTNGMFITPLATLFKFQGWTDKFLNSGKGNIAEGILDSYVSAAATLGGVKFMVVYHDFESDEDNASGDNDLGSEFGALAAKSFGKYGVEVRYADYSAGDSSAFNGGGLTLTDTQKAWVTFTANF